MILGRLSRDEFSIIPPIIHSFQTQLSQKMSNLCRLRALSYSPGAQELTVSLLSSNPLQSSGQLGIHWVDQAILKLRDPLPRLPSARVEGCATPPPHPTNMTVLSDKNPSANNVINSQAPSAAENQQHRLASAGARPQASLQPQQASDKMQGNV